MKKNRPNHRPKHFNCFVFGFNKQCPTNTPRPLCSWYLEMYKVLYIFAWGQIKNWSAFYALFYQYLFTVRKKLHPSADPEGWELAFSSLGSPTRTQYSRQSCVLELAGAWQTDNLLTVVHVVINYISAFPKALYIFFLTFRTFFLMPDLLLHIFSKNVSSPLLISKEQYYIFKVLETRTKTWKLRSYI